jgi:hypothetical protein
MTKAGRHSACRAGLRPRGRAPARKPGRPRRGTDGQRTRGVPAGLDDRGRPVADQTHNLAPWRKFFESDCDLSSSSPRGDSTVGTVSPEVAGGRSRLTAIQPGRVFCDLEFAPLGYANSCSKLSSSQPLAPRHAGRRARPPAQPQGRRSRRARRPPRGLRRTAVRTAVYDKAGRTLELGAPVMPELAPDKRKTPTDQCPVGDIFHSGADSSLATTHG